ncbi:MAG: hypothetical protein Kow00108_15920 [Calditrichia bacterium]
MKFNISSFEEIDFSQIDPNEDEFLLDGNTFKFSEHVCHVCWNGGTVLESHDSYYCLHCNNYLAFKEVALKFLDEEREKSETFLLPAEWNKKELDLWKSEFIEKRNRELKFRERMLNDQEGGDVL